MSSTRMSRHLNAPRERVYRALLDADNEAGWQQALDRLAALAKAD